MRWTVPLGAFLVAPALLACTSDLEKYKDAICACKDRACIERVRGSWETRGNPYDAMKGDVADGDDAKLRTEIESCTARAMENYDEGPDL